MKNSDGVYMARAIALAQKGKGTTSPNPMVGAVIVKNNKIIAEGWHRRCGSDHAEIIALKKAGKRAKSARLYVNLEPCFHYGRTPPCVDSIIRSGIKEIVIAMKDPNPVTNGKGIRKLKKAGIAVTLGVLEKEARRLNEVFIKYMRSKMPFVVAKSAQTLDGKIATANGHSQWITSRQSRLFARRRRDNFDAILVGINTILKDDPGLNGVTKNNLKKIILDPSLKISLSAGVFHRTSPQNIFIATTRKASSVKVERFRKKGIRILLSTNAKNEIHLRSVMKELAKHKITSILIEGGAKTIGRALKDNLVDVLNIYMAPKIIGDQQALSSIDGLGIRNVNRALRVKNWTVQQIDEEVFITGYVFRNR